MSDRFLSFVGTLADINAAIGLLNYVPDEDFNSGQHAELITVAIWQTESTEAKVRFRPVIDVAHNEDDPILDTIIASLVPDHLRYVNVTFSQ